MDSICSGLGITESRYKESDIFLQGNGQPLVKALQIALGAFFHEKVESDGFFCETANISEALSEIVTMDVGKAQGLDDPDTAGFGNGSHELRVGAGVHGSPDDGQLYAKIITESITRALTQAHLPPHGHETVPASSWN